MKLGLRWSAAVLAGLGWIFLTRLAGDLCAPWALQLPLMAPPLVVTALRLPYRPGAFALALIALLYDAALGIPFGLSASLALPLHLILFRIRHHLTADAALTGAALAFTITPALWLGTALALTLSGSPLPADLSGVLTEVALGAALAALGTPWLAGFTLSLLRLFGVSLDRGDLVRE